MKFTYTVLAILIFTGCTRILMDGTGNTMVYIPQAHIMTHVTTDKNSSMAKSVMEQMTQMENSELQIIGEEVDNGSSAKKHETDIDTDVQIKNREKK